MVSGNHSVNAVFCGTCYDGAKNRNWKKDVPVAKTFFGTVKENFKAFFIARSCYLRNYCLFDICVYVLFFIARFKSCIRFNAYRICSVFAYSYIYDVLCADNVGYVWTEISDIYKILLYLFSVISLKYSCNAFLYCCIAWFLYYGLPQQREQCWWLQ